MSTATVPGTTGIAGTGNQRGAVAQITAIIAAGLACLAALVAQNYLPDRFLLDHFHVVNTMNSAFADADADSFQFIAAVYRVLGLDGFPELAAMLTVVLFCAAMLAAARWDDIARFGIVGVGTMLVGLALAVVYLAQYSKESLSLIVVLILLLLPRGAFFDAVIVGVCVAYGLLVRPYWLLVAALYLMWRVVLPLVRNPLWLVGVALLVYLVLEPAFVAVLGGGLDSQREWANAERAGVEVASLIHSPFPQAEGLLSSLAAVILLLGLIVPVPLLTTGSVVHAGSAVIIAGLWAVAIASVVRSSRSGQTQASSMGTGAIRPVPGSSAGDGRGLRASRSLALLLAFVMVQAVFEPDYGSYLKHLTPMLPLFLALAPLRKETVR